MTTVKNIKDLPEDVREFKSSPDGGIEYDKSKKEVKEPEQKQKGVLEHVRDYIMTPTLPVKKAKGGKVRSASARADGCAIRGKTRA